MFVQFNDKFKVYFLAYVLVQYVFQFSLTRCMLRLDQGVHVFLLAKGCNESMLIIQIQVVLVICDYFAQCFQVIYFSFFMFIFNYHLLICFVYWNPQKTSKKRKSDTSTICCFVSHFGMNGSIFVFFFCIHALVRFHVLNMCSMY